MSLYTGLAPQDALAKWYAIRQKPQNALTPEEKNDLTGGMTDLAAQNPQAWQLVKTGVDDPTNAKNRKIFNTSTGEWDDQEKKGYWSHPESWMQLAGGIAMGGLGAAAAAGAIGGSAASAAPAAATAAGEFGPMAGGYAGATTAATIPAALDPAVAAFTVPAAVTGGGGGSASLLKQILGGGAGSTTNAGISALTTLLGTHMQNSAASDAAKTQADALKYSTDVQDAAAKRNELFLRQQAENSYANTESTRRANYDQWRAREARVSNLGAALGLSQRDIPDYVAGVDPRFLDTPPNVPIPGRAAGGPVNAGNPYVVGENGPEVVVPNQSGTVLPNNPYQNDWSPRNPDGSLADIKLGYTPPVPPINQQGITQGMRQAATAPDGVPVFQSQGKYFTRNADGSMTQQFQGGIPDWLKGAQPQTTGAPGGYTPQPGGDLMAALTQNYASLGAKPTGPGSGPTDIGYFAKRIAETGGMTPQNIAYWFGPSGRIAKELAGAVPPETSGGGASGAAATPYMPGSLGGALTRRTNFWWS